MTDNTLTSELLLETAQIPWHELQRFFAAGQAVCVDSSLDLLNVAEQITKDNATQIKMWMDAKLVDVVTDAQAKRWYDEDALVWAVVIKPWVLVQQKDASQ